MEEPKKPLKELVQNTPSLSLTVPRCYTNTLEKTRGKPMILRQAEAFRKALHNLPIIIRPDEIIVGTFDKKIPVAIPRPEGTGLRILGEIEDLPNRSVNPINVDKDDAEIFREEIAPFWRDSGIESYARKIAPEKIFEIFYSGGSFIPTEVGGVAHAVIDYPRLLSSGLGEYIERAGKKIKSYKKDLKSDPKAEEKIAFYKSIRIVAKALLDFAHSYSEKAREMATQENDPTRRKELEKIAEVCKRVPENPARDMNEALQFIWFVHLALHIENFEHGISFGRLDKYLSPYYEGDYDESLRLFRNLFLKTNEIVALYGSIATQYFGGMATTQGLNIGGLTEEEKDVTNDLTYIILDAIKENSLPSPNLIIRRHEGTPSELYRKISDLLSEGLNIVALTNDETVTEGLTNHGVSPRDARNYGIVGCVGLSTSGSSFDNTGAVFLNLAKALEITLQTEDSIVSEHINPQVNPENFDSMKDVLESFKKNLRRMMELAVSGANAFQYAHKELKPTPLMSLTIDGCFEDGRDVNRGSANYNFSGIHVTGFSDVVDSLAAINHAVFVKNKINMAELIDALKENFTNHSDLKNYLKEKCPSYGNDDDEADIYAEKVGEILSESVEGLRCVRGDEWRVGIHAMTTHVGFGKFTGALPSGRQRGEPLAKDIAPALGGREGLTGSLKSITKVDHSLMTNGMACTFNINPEVARIENGRIFETLLETYFEMGGEHIQFNAVSPSTLKEAQRSPGEYQNLMVRVSGYSARFVELPESVQDEIISRYCYKE